MDGLCALGNGLKRNDLALVVRITPDIVSEKLVGRLAAGELEVLRGTLLVTLHRA